MTIERIEGENTNAYILANDNGNQTAFPVGTASLIMQREPGNIGAGKIFQIAAGGFNLGFRASAVENIETQTDEELFEVLQALLFSKSTVEQ